MRRSHLAAANWSARHRYDLSSSPAAASPSLPLPYSLPSSLSTQVRAELLQGSPVLEEARQRQAALQQQWATLATSHFSADPASFPPEVWNEAAFLRAFCVVLASTVYLESAACFALVPLASSMGHTGNDNGCSLDYDEGSGSVKVVTTRPYRCVGGVWGGREGCQEGLRRGVWGCRAGGWGVWGCQEEGLGSEGVGGVSRSDGVCRVVGRRMGVVGVGGCQEE